jgi:xanthine dehydrogenase iron-sulfur cluster and FAD-binding subunit A
MVGGNLCRCTGYHNNVASVLRAAEIQRERKAGAGDGRAAGDQREQEASQP